MCKKIMENPRAERRYVPRSGTLIEDLRSKSSYQSLPPPGEGVVRRRRATDEGKTKALNR